MSNQTNNKKFTWKTQLYMLGAGVGTILGFLSAYLFTREVENSGELDEDQRPEIPPSALLGMALSVLTVVRKIAETAKTDKSRKK